MIRIATPADIVAVVAIYNQAIESSFQTAFMQPLSIEERRSWFNEHMDPAYPIFVYVADEKVVGWLSIGPYRSGREALRFIVEVSYYLDTEYQGRGIGSALLAHSIQACKDLGYKDLVAIILEKNTISIKLMKKFGFTQWAHLPAIANFNGIECGQVYYGLRLS